MTEFHDAVRRLKALLDEIDPARPTAALDELGEARELLTTAIDEAMAASVLEGQSTRQVSASVGLSPNAVPPRLARSPRLAPYATGGKVSADGIARARYDEERGTALKFTPDERTLAMTDTAYTHLEFVLDRSGSMSSIRTATQDGFNAFIADQRGRAGRATVSLQQFDDTFDTVYTMVPIDQVPPLTLEPRGSTALLDAVGRTIVALGSRLAAMPEGERPGTVIVGIMTDGMENASREFTHDQIRAMITEQESAYSWTFMYMGADQDAIEVGMSMGISADRSLTYAREAAAPAMAAYSAGVGRMRESRLQGAGIDDARSYGAYSATERAQAAPAPAPDDESTADTTRTFRPPSPRAKFTKAPRPFGKR